MNVNLLFFFVNKLFDLGPAGSTGPTGATGSAGRDRSVASRE
jgi:hypothetical protein